MSNKKSTAPLASTEIPTSFTVGPSDFSDSFIDKLDHKKIKSIEGQIKDLKERNSKKVYALKLTSDLLTSLIGFVEENAEWSQTESLGVIEVHKILSGIKKKG
jgi:hypothetical protein